MKQTTPATFKNFQKIIHLLNISGRHRGFKLIFALAVFSLTSLSVSAAVTVDNTSSNKASSLVGLSSLTWSHTVSSGTEKALYVGVSSATTTLPASVAPSLLSVDFVTYNGVRMTRVGSVQSPGVLSLGIVSKSYVDIYRLVNPPSGTYNVVVRFSTLLISPSLFVNFAVGGAVSYNGVDQITPNGTFSGNSGTGTAPNVMVNGGTDQDFIMDTLASSPNAEDFTVALEQELRWEGNFDPALSPSFDLGAGSTQPGSNLPVSMNWTLEDPNGWALGGLAIRAASNPPSVFTVNSLLDNESDGCTIDGCTLREAINDANNTPQPDTINFAPNVVGTITLTGGQLVAASDITINGPGARNLVINGRAADRVFLIATPLLGGDTTVNISGLTVQNGYAQPPVIGSTLIGDGGGILNGALLGILSGTSTLNLTEVSVNANRATTLGGGVATRLNAVTNITRSTISNNVSNAVVPDLGGDVGGGGISNVGGITNISNSTVSNNNSLAAGGGILNAAGIVNSTNNTITNNRSTLAGGGVVSVVGVLIPTLGVANVRNTIIANNNDLLGTDLLGRDVVGVLGSFNSLGNNLIGSNFGAEVTLEANVYANVSDPLTPQANGDFVGGVDIGNRIMNPLLGALQNNGGPTNTRLPLTGSPAIDRGNDCVLTNACATATGTALTIEQRGVGFPRKQGAAVEIGSVEGLAPTAADISLSGRVVQKDGRVISGAIVTLTSSAGNTLSTKTNLRGAYSFSGIESGQIYFLEVQHKQYVFPSQTVSPNASLFDLNFIGTFVGESDTTVKSTSRF